MNQEKVLEVFVQLRKTYNLLGEIMDCSRQMAESLDRDDNTAFQMLLTMRREPIQELAATKERVQELLSEFPGTEGEQLRSVLNGAPGSDPLEEKIADQVGANSRLFQQISELDCRLSDKVAHERSVYARNNT